MKFSLRSLLSSLFVVGMGGTLGFWTIQNGFSALMAETTTASSSTDLTSQESLSLSEVRSTEDRFNLTLLEALTIAESEVDGQTYAIEQEIEEGIPVIEVALSKYEVVVDGLTGNVLLVEDQQAKGDPEDINEFTEALALQPHTVTTLAEAIVIAEAFADGEAQSAELENEDGNLFYEVMLGLRQVYVDAGDGRILDSAILRHRHSQKDTSLKRSIQVSEEE